MLPFALGPLLVVYGTSGAAGLEQRGQKSLILQMQYPVLLFYCYREFMQNTESEVCMFRPTHLSEPPRCMPCNPSVTLRESAKSNRFPIDGGVMDTTTDQPSIIREESSSARNSSSSVQAIVSILAACPLCHCALHRIFSPTGPVVIRWPLLRLPCSRRNDYCMFYDNQAPCAFRTYARRERVSYY